MKNNIFATQLQVTQQEEEVRQNPKYVEIRDSLPQCQQVLKYKEDPLEIPLISNRGKIGNRQIKEPICIGDCPHIVMDLYDLLLEEKILGCKPCNIHPNRDNIKREQFYKRLVTQINEKAFICSFIADQVFHAYESDLQDRGRALLKSNILEKVIERSNQEEIWKNFCEQIRYQNNLENFPMNLSLIRIPKIHLFCLINCQKIIIPIIIEGCNHLEFYEFTNLLALCKENEAKSYPQKSRKCFHKTCGNQIPLNLDDLCSKMQYPQQLAATISKEYSFVLSLNWDLNTHKFTYTKDSYQDNFILHDFQKYLVHDSNHIYIFGSYRKIVNRELPEDLNFKLKFSSYKVTVKGIKYPVRCINCPLFQCLDLKDFILSEIKQMSQNRYKPSFTCPVCKHKFENYEKLPKIVYLDPYLAKQISQNQKAEEIEQNKYCEFQQYFCLSQNLTFQQVKQIYLNDKIDPYQNHNCCIDPQKILKDPVVVIPNCLCKRAFQFSNFQAFLQENSYSLSTFSQEYSCSCNFCKSREFKISDFYFDEFYGTLLNKYPKPIDWELNIKFVLEKHFQDDNNFDTPVLQDRPVPVPSQIHRPSQVVQPPLFGGPYVQQRFSTPQTQQSQPQQTQPPPQQQPTARYNQQPMINNFIQHEIPTIRQQRDQQSLNVQPSQQFEFYQQPTQISFVKYEKINNKLEPVMKK